MKVRLSEAAEESQSMSAMTDVVFLLLIFFLVTMSSYVEMTLLETGLPSPGGASSEMPADSIRIIVRAPEAETPEACFEVDAVPMTGPELAGMLRRYGRLQPDVEIRIGCAGDSFHRDLVRVLSLCSRSGLKNLKMFQL